MDSTSLRECSDCRYGSLVVEVTSLPGWFFLLPLDDESSRLSRTLEEEVGVSQAELTVLCPSSDKSEFAVLRVGEIDLGRLCLVAPVKKSRCCLPRWRFDISSASLLGLLFELLSASDWRQD